jgi:hypothetical protein
MDFDNFGMDLEKFRFDGQNAQVKTCANLQTRSADQRIITIADRQI